MSKFKSNLDIVKNNSIIIENKAWQKMCYYLKQSKGEVGGLIVVDDSDGLRITDIILPKQTVSMASVVLDVVGIMTELVQKNPEIIPKIKGWWHSHQRFGCFWSSTDDETTENLLKYGMPYCLSLVQSEQLTNTNKKENYLLAKVSIKKPRMDFDGIRFFVVGNHKFDFEKENKLMDDNVAFKKFKPFKNKKQKNKKIDYEDEDMEDENYAEYKWGSDFF